MTALLSGQRNMTAATASDPLIAMQKMKQARPDVIVLDLEMPRMDGLTFLRKIMTEDPIPVVVCSSLAGEGTEAAFRALEEGAVDIVAKPQLGVKGFLEDSATILIDTIYAAAQARAMPKKKASNVSVVAEVLRAEKKPLLTRTTMKVVAIGASTGGTEALRTLLEAMPPDCPGIVIVQHMPQLFTAAFAHRLNQICRIEVKEAVNGDRLIEGRALIAPGNKHMSLHRNGAHYIVNIADGPLVSRHRPSVDVLFQSVARAAGVNAIGVIMTGMGDDGADGLLKMRNAGAATIAQDERTSVVFGMPKEAIVRGAVDEVVPLSKIPGVILKRAVATVPRRM
jgi:two-component system chemotaxis response regulator CheB